MKTSMLAFLAVLASSPVIHAEDTIGDHIRRAVDKTRDKVQEITRDVRAETRDWRDATKENLQLDRPEYTERADKALSRYIAEIGVLKDLSGGPGQRDYFKTRVLALDQQAAFATAELNTLRLSESEDVFRARQRSFDRTLSTLEAALGQAQEEAGL
jgi:hypothetical protein